MDRPTKPSGRHAVRLRWDEIITRLSYRFNFFGHTGLTRQAREVQQWTASELIDGYRFEGRQSGKTLPQLPRFGMSVAQEYF